MSAVNEPHEANVSIDKKNCKFEEFIKIIKIFCKQFGKFYIIRFLISLLKKLIKIRFNITKISLNDYFQLFFNSSNTQTGLFLSLMPALFKILNLAFSCFESFNDNPKVATFISGFISSLVGIICAEKANFLNFIILSVMVRSLHSFLIINLKKKGYPEHNKIVGWLILTIACTGVLLSSFYNPSFRPITKLIDRYGLYFDNERDEMKHIREGLRIV